MLARAFTPRHLLLALTLVPLAASQAHALPPALVVTGIASLGWLAALITSLASLLLVHLAPRARRAAAVSLGIAIALSLLIWKGSPPRNEQAKNTEELVITGETATPWIGDPTSAWFDLRTRAAYLDGHIVDAKSVPLLLRSVFNPRLIDRLDAAPTLIAHLPQDPDLKPEAWGALDAHWYEGDVAIIEAIARIEAMSRRALETGEITRVVLYCYSGRTSKALARILKARQLPVHVVDGGINALPSASLKSARQSAHVTRGEAVTMAAPSRRDLSIWARSEFPPALFHAIDTDRPIHIIHNDRATAGRAAWAAALLSTWGYEHVVTELPASVTQPVPGRALRLIGLVSLLTLLCLSAIISAQTSLRSALSARPSPRHERGIIAAQVIALFALQSISGPYWGAWSTEPLHALISPFFAELARCAVALGALWLLMRPAMHQRVAAIEAARHRLGGVRVAPLPYPRLDPTKLAISATSALLITWVHASIVALMIGFAALSRITQWSVNSWLIYRVSSAPSDEVAAIRLLKGAGLAPRASQTPAHHTITTFRPEEPARFTRVEPHKGGQSIGLFTGGYNAQRAAQIAALLGRDVRLRFIDEHGAYNGLVLLETERAVSPLVHLHTQLLEALWRAARQGISVSQWEDYQLTSARYEEGAPTPSPLTLSVLRRRASPEGAYGAAARRFGWSIRRPLIIHLGRHAYDMEPRKTPRTRRSLLALLSCKAVLTEALAKPPQTLTELWCGALVTQAEESALAIAVARAEVHRLAARAEVPPMPPLADNEEPVPLPANALIDAPYELAALRSPETMESSNDLIAPHALAYGPGPEPLRQWRGVLRSAELRRHLIRGALGQATRALSKALRTQHGEAVTLRTCDAVDTRAPARALPADIPLPERLELAALEGAGTPAANPLPVSIQGASIGLTHEVIGRVTHSQPPSAGEISVVERVELGALSRCPKGTLIVAERGSPLSHAALVARERGVSLVLGARGARTALLEGQHLKVTSEGTLTLMAYDDAT